MTSPRKAWLWGHGWFQGNSAGTSPIFGRHFHGRVRYPRWRWMVRRHQRRRVKWWVSTWLPSRHDNGCMIYDIKCLCVSISPCYIYIYICIYIYIDRHVYNIYVFCCMYTNVYIYIYCIFRRYSSAWFNFLGIPCKIRTCHHKSTSSMS